MAPRLVLAEHSCGLVPLVAVDKVFANLHKP